MGQTGFLHEVGHADAVDTDLAKAGSRHPHDAGVALGLLCLSTALARTVRVQIVTAPAALSREGQKQLVKEATEIVTKISGDPTQAARTWVLLTEAAEGDWGLSGTAFGREEFAALAAKARPAT